MGLGIMSSSASSYDWRTKAGTLGETSERKKKLPNPDPKNYRIQDFKQFGDFLIIKLRYPDCTNYEGNKILVYRGAFIEDLRKQGSIDPHFCDNPKFHSPVARFVPTDEGMKMAEKFCLTIGELS